MSERDVAAPTAAGSTPAGNVKVTRDDWLRLALDVLVSEGVEQVKVLNLSTRLGVSRSSFYWYFSSRKALLDALLKHWEKTNTEAILAQCRAPSATITEAVCNLFRCFVDPRLFNPQLDFAIREWSRRAGPVRRVLDRSDEARIKAIAAMFSRHGYEDYEAFVRARILYYMQVGYYALELHESMEERVYYLRGYLKGFTGQEPRTSELEEMARFALAAAARDEEA